MLKLGKQKHGHRIVYQASLTRDAWFSRVKPPGHKPWRALNRVASPGKLVYPDPTCHILELDPDQTMYDGSCVAEYYGMTFEAIHNLIGLKEAETWTFAASLEGWSIVGTTWTFKREPDEDSKGTNSNGRLVAKGYITQLHRQR